VENRNGSRGSRPAALSEVRRNGDTAASSVAWFVIVLTLAGCVTATERQQQMSAAMDECAKAKTAFARVQCNNEAENRIYAGHVTPLMLYKQAAALNIAERLDRGVITEQQAKAEMAMVFAKISAQEEAQEAARAQAVGQAMQNAGAALQSIR
jgi:hypothetical protein